MPLLTRLDPRHGPLLPADFHAHGGQAHAPKFVANDRVVTTQKEFLFVVSSAEASEAQVRVQGSDTTWTIQLPQVGFWAMDGRGDGRMALPNGSILEHGRPKEESTRFTVRFVVFSKDGEPDNNWAEDILAAADRATVPILSSRPVPPSIQRLLDAGLRPAGHVPPGWLGKRPSRVVIGSHRAHEHNEGLRDLHRKLRGLLARIRWDKGEEDRFPNTFGACGWSLTWAYWACIVLEKLGEDSPFFQPLLRGLLDALEWNEAFLLRQRANARVLGTRGSMRVVNGAAGLRLVALLQALDPESLETTLDKIQALVVLRTGYQRPSVDTGIAIQLNGEGVVGVVRKVMRHERFGGLVEQARTAYEPYLEDQSSAEVAEVYRLAAVLIQTYDEGFERDEVAYGLTAFERYYSRLRGSAAGGLASARTREGAVAEVNSHLPADAPIQLSASDIISGTSIADLRLRLEAALVEREGLDQSAQQDPVVLLVQDIKEKAKSARQKGGKPNRSPRLAPAQHRRALPPIAGAASQVNRRVGTVSTAFMGPEARALALTKPLQARLEASQNSERLCFLLPVLVAAGRSLALLPPPPKLAATPLRPRAPPGEGQRRVPAGGRRGLPDGRPQRGAAPGRQGGQEPGHHQQRHRQVGEEHRPRLPLPLGLPQPAR